MIPPTDPGRHGLAVASCPASRRSSSPPVLTSFTAHLPETFDPAVTRPEWAAYACWVVSAVVIRRYVDKDADDNTFVPLDHEYIDRHIPRKVRKPLLEDLKQAGVLECDGVYYFGCPSGKRDRRHVPGPPGKCLCYRLGPAHRGAKIRPHPLTHPELLRKVSMAYQQERAGVTAPVHIALRGWHDRVEVLPAAPHGEHPLLDRLIEGERRFTVCAQGRVHTNCANLPRQYRQYIRLDGRELESLDIVNSQQLLMAVLLKRREEERSRSREAVCDPCSDASKNDYLRDCLDGSVYDRLAALTGRTRDDVKSMFLAVIYGHPADMHTRVGEAVRRLYPGVFDAVVDLNYRLGHGGLPRMMQAMESGVMIRRVAARLLREWPGMPLLTVHDSILAPAEYSDHVLRVIEEEWLDEFGVVPLTKTSTFTSPQEARKKRPKRRGRSAWKKLERTDRGGVGGRCSPSPA
ncbi:MAG TPA: hypothetical protein VD866_30250 [Urbifossiella sp.]|nr:hypothetical protein [Urbifossiella sp.]